MQDQNVILSFKRPGAICCSAFMQGIKYSIDYSLLPLKRSGSFWNSEDFWGSEVIEGLGAWWLFLTWSFEISPAVWIVPTCCLGFQSLSLSLFPPQCLTDIARSREAKNAKESESEKTRIWKPSWHTSALLNLNWKWVSLFLFCCILLCLVIASHRRGNGHVLWPVHCLQHGLINCPISQHREFINLSLPIWSLGTFKWRNI